LNYKTHTDTNMETSQGNSLCSYLNETNMSFCFLLQKQRIDPVWGVSTSGSGEDAGMRLNMVQILCTHVCKWKNEIC
jgi:hypothetical protein